MIVHQTEPKTDCPAEVGLSCGRFYLQVRGIVIAMEGDRCRAANLPADLYDPIPPEELAGASIGDKAAADLPPNLVRFFRGERWNEALLRYVAQVINSS